MNRIALSKYNVLRNKLLEYEKYKQLNMNITKQSSGQIGKILGLDKEIAHLNLDEHNALYDVYSILLGLRKLGFTQLF